MIRLVNMTVRRDACPVVDAASLTLNPGECVGLIGPNGAGKTTLMRAALGLLPFEGTSSLARLSAAERAKTCAWLPQARDVSWPMSVERIVALGRLPHQGGDGAVDKAIAALGLGAMRTRPATALSGGEQARVLIARMLAQETPFLFADEPIAGLDPAAQIDTMRLFSRLAQEGRGVLVSLHDLGLAARHCTRLVLMQAGRIVTEGKPEAVLSEKHLADVFRITAHMSQSDRGPLFQALDTLT